MHKTPSDMDPLKQKSLTRSLKSIDLPPNQQLVKHDYWPVVGEKHPAQSSAPWTLSISTDHEEIARYDLNQLHAMPWVTKSIDVHCVTRWSKPLMTFEGIPLADLISSRRTLIGQSNVSYLSFVARSDRQHSTSLPLDEALVLEPMIAFRAEGRPLSIEHGGPIRMVVPGKYFYKSVKWLTEIRFLKDDCLGYWESQAGYHNGADPWKEQRYISSTVSKHEAQALISSRNFSAKELLSLQASKLDLSGLVARGAVLRNADFSGCNLVQADFREANLSNANFDAADLKSAKFCKADLEGADFSDADLRGANFTDASLFGTSMAKLNSGQSLTHRAQIDRSTIFSNESIQSLTREQREYVVAKATMKR